MMARALWSVRRTASRGGAAVAEAARRAGARSPLRTARFARSRGRAIRRGDSMERGVTVGPVGGDTCGAKVEGVALGLRAFGVEIADGAALGL
jgi:hypothetical protein